MSTLSGMDALWFIVLEDSLQVDEEVLLKPRKTRKISQCMPLFPESSCIVDLKWKSILQRMQRQREKSLERWKHLHSEDRLSDPSQQENLKDSQLLDPTYKLSVQGPRMVNLEKKNRRSKSVESWKTIQTADQLICKVWVMRLIDQKPKYKMERILANSTTPFKISSKTRQFRPKIAQ